MDKYNDLNFIEKYWTNLDHDDKYLVHRIAFDNLEKSIDVEKSQKILKLYEDYRWRDALGENRIGNLYFRI